jgi:glutathione S-transferase
VSDFVLHCFAQSGNAYKAALALQLGKANWEARFVDYFGGETRTREYRAINVMGEVPLLVHNGLTLSQSGVILDYISETLDQFGPRDAAERREILRWVLFDNHKLTSYTATLRFMQSFTEAPDPAVVKFLRGRAETAWGVLNTHLAGRKFVVGEHLTIADLSLCGYLFWPDEIGVDWNAYPNLRDWLARIAALPRYRPAYELMPGHPRPAAT